MTTDDLATVEAALFARKYGWPGSPERAAVEALVAEVRRLRQELRKAHSQISDEDVCCHGVGFDQDCEDCEQVEAKARLT